MIDRWKDTNLFEMKILREDDTLQDIVFDHPASEFILGSVKITKNGDIGLNNDNQLVLRTQFVPEDTYSTNNQKIDQKIAKKQDKFDVDGTLILSQNSGATENDPYWLAVNTNIIATKNDIKDFATQDSLDAVQRNVDRKQDKLIAGDNITINPDTNVISATGGGGSSNIPASKLTEAEITSLKRLLERVDVSGTDVHFTRDVKAPSFYDVQ